MTSSRLEAFSGDVLAIIITIMVLKLKAREEVELKDLLAKAPIFLCYVASFVYVGIYWNNLQHLFQITKQVSGKILWAICIYSFGYRSFPLLLRGLAKSTQPF